MRQLRDLDSDAAFVAAMGMSQASYSRVKNNKQRPGTQFMAALCVALNVKPSDILAIGDADDAEVAA